MERLVRVCFDTSVWIAILEKDQDHDLASITGWIDRVDRQKATLLFPTVVLCELFSSRDDARQRIIDLYLQRPNVELLDLTLSIAKAGALLRVDADSDRLKLKTPDALIIASASHHRADILISCDRGIVRLDGQYGIKCKIGLPACGFDQPLFDLPED